MNCGQETPLESVDQSGSGPADPAGAGKYSAVLNGIRPGAGGGLPSDLRCLPAAAGTTGPPTEQGKPEAGRGLGPREDRVNSSPRRRLGHLAKSRTRTNISRGTTNPWGGLVGEGLTGVGSYAGGHPKWLTRRWLGRRRTIVRGPAASQGRMSAYTLVEVGRRHHRQPRCSSSNSKRPITTMDVSPPLETGQGAGQLFQVYDTGQSIQPA